MLFSFSLLVLLLFFVRGLKGGFKLTKRTAVAGVLARGAGAVELHAADAAEVVVVGEVPTPCCNGVPAFEVDFHCVVDKGSSFGFLLLLWSSVWGGYKGKRGGKGGRRFQTTEAWGKHIHCKETRFAIYPRLHEQSNSQPDCSMRPCSFSARIAHSVQLPSYI